MAEMKPEQPVRRGPLFFVGAGGLLAMMLVETAAVIGRRIGMPLMGALEIVQFAIVPAACAAMLIATLHSAHAAVHMLTDRMPEHLRQRALRFGSLLAGLLFTALCAGSAWLAAEHWNAFEETEVLDLPVRPLRVLITLAAAAIGWIFFRHAFARRQAS